MERRLSFSLKTLFVLLIFSHLIFSIAVPTTRTQRLLLQGRDANSFTDCQSVCREGTMKKFVSARVDLELNDYQGSGANNRHTPKPPGRE